MTVVVISLLTALLFGSGDFLGGVAAKRVPVVTIVAGSHLVGLAGVAALAVLTAERFRLTDVGLGAAGGALGGLGVALLYRRLAAGPMHVVAPLTALTSAVVPAAWGLATGERLSAVAWVGVALSLVAIGAVSSARNPADSAPVTPVVVVESLAAGAGFAGFFIFLDLTDAASAPWPIVGARLCTSAVLVVVLAVWRRPIGVPDRAAGTLIIGAGLFDVGANVAFLYATNEGDLAIVSVLTSLYPVATIVLARLVLGERMSRPQGAGLGLALLATTIIAVG